MSNSKKAKIKKKIQNDCVNAGGKQYRTTYKDIKKYFKLINDAVFDGLLSPFNDIDIKDLTKDHVYGQVWIKDDKRKGTRWYLLEMSDKYKNKEEFLNTLAHEMVHLFQMANCGDSGNHNSLFYDYKNQMKQVGLGQI